MDMQNKAVGYKSIGVRFLAALIKIYEARGVQVEKLLSKNKASETWVTDVKQEFIELSQLGLNHSQIAQQLNKRGCLYRTRMQPKGVAFTAQHVSLIINGRMYWDDGKFVSCMRDRQIAKRNREYRKAKENSNKIATLYNKASAERIRNPHNKL